MKCAADKSALVRNFSKCAHLYDRYANIQNMAASGLIKEIGSDNALNILEAGCGTGNYTYLLRNKFEAARVKAVDISKEMIEAARRKLQGYRIEFIVADCEKMELSDRFDLITGNSVFHWFRDMESAISKFKNALVKDGVISFSAFGPLTFKELGVSLKEVMGEDAMIDAAYFMNGEELKTILENHFEGSVVKERLVQEEYGSLRELLSNIKHTGTRGNGVSGLLSWNRRLLNRVEATYKSRFGKIKASYQIFFCKAIR